MERIRQFHGGTDLSIDLCKHDGLDGYLILELKGVLSLENSDRCMKIIESQHPGKYGTILILDELRYANTSGWHVLFRVITENIRKKKRTIAIGAKEPLRTRISKSTVDLLSLCGDYVTIQDFIDHERT